MKPESQPLLPEWILKRLQTEHSGDPFIEIRQKSRAILLANGLPSPDEEFYRETNLLSEFASDPQPVSRLMRMDIISAPPSVSVSRQPGPNSRPAGALAETEDGYQNLFWQQVNQGSWIEIPSGFNGDSALHIGAGKENPEVAYRQIFVGRAADCRIMVDYTHSKHLFTEIYVEEDANLEIAWKFNNPKEWVLSHTIIHQAANSQVKTVGFSLNAKKLRNNLKVILAGERGSHEAFGLSLGQDEQHSDNHINMCHMAPKCHSLQLFKSILADKSTGTFCGRILVAPGAQETEAYQQNRNLLISDTALMRSRPQLEIYADNVKCSHGATTGELREEALFYLRSRGIGREEARHMLTVAFAQEVISASSQEGSQKEAIAALEELFLPNP